MIVGRVREDDWRGPAIAGPIIAVILLSRYLASFEEERPCIPVPL